MKLAYYCLLTLANVMAISTLDTDSLEGLTSTTGEIRNAGEGHVVKNGTDVWNKTGGFYYNNAGVKLFYTTEGSGNPVILIHGWTCDQSDWIFQIPFLLDHGFQVISIDQRGHGRSSVPDPSVYSYDPVAFSEDAAALLSHLEVGNSTKKGPAIAMGHSLGGVVASELAFRHPELVKALVLVDSAYYTPAEQGALFAATLRNSSIGRAPDIAAQYFESQESLIAERPPWMRVWRQHKTWGNPEHIVSAVFGQLITFLQQWSSSLEYRKERQGVPKLVTVADQSSADLEVAVGLAQEDRVEVLSGGHWHFQINSVKFNDIVKDWFIARGYVKV